MSLTAPTELRYTGASDDFAAGYIKYYVCNDAVISPQFGDKKADGEAKEKLTLLVTVQVL